MSHNRASLVSLILFVVAATAPTGCVPDSEPFVDAEPGGSGGEAGTGGQAGSSGEAGTGGQAGSSGEAGAAGGTSDDCLDVPGGRAYSDRCGVCIDRDGSGAVALWSDETDRNMGDPCTTITLSNVWLAEGIRAHVQANSSEVSSAYVYLRDTQGKEVGAIHVTPGNFEAVESTAMFDAPVEVESLEVCSWWNPATLLDVTLLGHDNACEGDCAGNWPGEHAYRDTCGACIERKETRDQLYYDGTDRPMTDSCKLVNLPQGYLVEEVFANVKNEGGATSNAWVYLLDASGKEVGGLNTTPANGGFVSGSTEFDPPVPAAALRLCSWWNDATLLDLELRGNSAACSP